MSYTLDFSHYYQAVRPIVLRLRGLYYLKLWDKDDWEQEGMLSLYCLLEQRPDLMSNPEQLRVCFKTKFSNHVNDELRKQESQKRQLNKLAYEDISEVAHLVPSQGMLLDDYIVFQDSLALVRQGLTALECQQLEELSTGKAFKGRKRLVRKVQQLMAVM